MYMKYLAIYEFRLILYSIFILFTAFLLNWQFRRALLKSINTSELLSKSPSTRISFLRNLISALIWVVAVFSIIFLVPTLRSYAISLFAGAGVLLAILGFAAQHAFSNIVSGFFIIIFKPFQIGDRIKVGDLSYGIVEDITMRHTVIVNFENKRIIIPNSILSSETIVNDVIEDQKICRFIEIGVSYSCDIKLATRIIKEVCEAHPDTMDNRNNPTEDIVDVRLIAFQDSSILLRALVWTDKPLTTNSMHSQINFSLLEAFKANNIEIPFPQRTLHITERPNL